MKYLNLLIPIILLGTTVFSQNGESKSYAVVIGVSDYSKFNSQQDLNYADDDAKMFSEFLTEQGCAEIMFYSDSKATNKDEIGNAITDILLNKTQPGDRAIIYFAGHAVIDKIEDEGFLLLHNACSEINGDFAVTDALKMEFIIKRAIKADERGVEVLLVFDACHAGKVESSPSIDKSDAFDNNSVLMLSSKSQQTSQESQIYKHGVFTYFLVNGLQGMADVDSNKTVTYKELESYVKDNVMKVTNESQTPIFRGPYLFELSTVTHSNSENVSSISNNQNEIKTRGIGAQDKLSYTKSDYLFSLMQRQIQNDNFFQDQSVDELKKKIEFKNASQYHISMETPQLLTYSKTKNVSLFNNSLIIRLNLNKVDSIIIEMESNELNFTDLSFNERYLISCIKNKKLVLWDLENSTSSLVELDVDDKVTALKFSGNDIVLIGTEKGNLIYWDWRNNKKHQYRQHRKAISDIESDGNNIYTSGLDGQIVVFNTTTSKKEKKIKTNSDEIYSIEINIDDHKLISADSDRKISLWDLKNCTKQREIQLKSSINVLENDPLNNYCFIGTIQKEVYALDLFSFKLIDNPLKTKSSVQNLIYNFDAEKLFVLTDNNGFTEVDLLVDNRFNCANETRDLLLNLKEFKDKKYLIDGAFTVGLNTFVTHVIESRVNGYTNIDKEILQKAKMYAKKSLEIGKDNILDENRLEINLLILEVFEIIDENQIDKYDDAIDKLLRIQGLDSTNSFSFNMASEIYIRTNSIENAKKMNNRAKSNAPSWLKPKITDCIIEILEGDLKGAEIGLREVIQINPNITSAHINLANVYFYLGQPNNAILEIEKAKTIDSSIVLEDETYQNYIYWSNKFDSLQKLDDSKFNVAKTLRSIQNASFNLSLGAPYQGGVVFYLEKNKKHGLIFTNITDESLNWNDAKSRCNGLIKNGYSDWYLPSLIELNNLLFYLNKSTLTSASIWSSNVKDNNSSFWINFPSGVASYSLNTNKRSVIAIRKF
jgi:uncharacterized caspase-like protein/tetratricopeptide (TPR) repeat protein